MSGRRILITGGAGFIGVHLTRHLAQDESAEIVIVDSFVRGVLDHELSAMVTDSPRIRLVSGDLTKEDVFKEIGGGFDEVYHLAAIIGVDNVLKKPHEVVRVNAISTLNVLDWFIKGGGDRILFSSTSEAYAWTQQFHELPVPTPEDVPLALTDLRNARSSYAGSKIFGELAVTQLCTMAAKRFSIVRYHNVYGPRMGDSHVIPQLHFRALNGENPLKVYSANYRRAFCYVSDAINATVAAARNAELEGQTFNIGNDREEVEIGELAKRILEKAGVDAAIQPETAPNDPIMRRVPDITRARTLLGYEPKVTLDEGLNLTLEWYSKRYAARS